MRVAQNRDPIECSFFRSIRNTSPLSKTGVCRGVPISFIFGLNIDCGYSLKPSVEAVLTCTHDYVLSKNLSKERERERERERIMYSHCNSTYL